MNLHRVDYLRILISLMIFAILGCARAPRNLTARNPAQASALERLAQNTPLEAQLVSDISELRMRNYLSAMTAAREIFSNRPNQRCETKLKSYEISENSIFKNYRIGQFSQRDQELEQVLQTYQLGGQDAPDAENSCREIASGSRMLRPGECALFGLTATEENYGVSLIVESADLLVNRIRQETSSQPNSISYLCNRTNRPARFKLYGYIKDRHPPSDEVNSILLYRFFRGGRINSSSFVTAVNRSNDIEVLRIENNRDFVTEFDRTGRSLPQIASRIFPARYLDVNEMVSRSQRVLDAGCGTGDFVVDLVNRGVNAQGIDLEIDGPWVRDPLFRRKFTRGDMTQMPYPGASFDIIYSIYTIFSNYYDAANRDLIHRALVEMKRVLKVNGLIRIAPFDVDLAVVQEIPGLEVVAHGTTPEGSTFVEIKKLL